MYAAATVVLSYNRRSSMHYDSTLAVGCTRAHVPCAYVLTEMAAARTVKADSMMRQSHSQDLG